MTATLGATVPSSTGSAPEMTPERTRGPVERIGRAMASFVAPGTAMIYFSLLVLIPIAAVAANAFSGGWSGFWGSVHNPESWAALKLTLISALIVVVVNTIAGTAIAWVLVRDQFPGKRVIASVVDLPFALPTLVAGLTLLSLYGPDSPFHLTRPAPGSGCGSRWRS